MIRVNVCAVLLTVAVAGAGVAACHRAVRQSADGSPVVVSGVIVHGVASVTGTAFEQRLVLNTGNGSRRIHASAADSMAFVRVAGLELSVHGVEEGSALRMERFVVVSANGAPVADGILRADGDRLSIETEHGRVALGNPPQSLRGLVGARVWIQGPLDRGPNTYGVIVPRG